MGKFILKGSIGTVDIIELHGILLEKNTIELRDQLLERLKQGITDIVLLCENFKQIDSTGISLFIEISDHLQSRGGKLHLVGCPLSVMIPMKSLGMVNFFQFYKTEQEAMQNLKITREEVGKVVTQKTTKAAATQIKKQVSIRDHMRNKMILFKHYETATVKDIILYLQSTYAHFKEKNIELAWHGKKLSRDQNLKQLYEEHHYDPKGMLEIEEAGPQVPNYQEMIRQGGNLYNQAILDILTQKGCLEAEIAKSVQQIADLNQEPVTTTLLDGEYLSEEKMLKAIGDHFNWQTVQLRNVNIPPQVARILSIAEAEANCVVPVRQEGKKLWVAIGNPLDAKRLSTLEKATGCEIVPLFAAEFSIRQKLDAMESAQKLEKKPVAADTGSKEVEVTGYFSVDSFLSSTPVRNLQEYTWENSLPGFLEETITTLRKLEQSWESLQKFAMQIYGKGDLNAILTVILDALVAVVPVEHGIFMLDMEGKGNLEIKRLPDIKEYQNISDRDFHKIASQALLSRVKETHNIVGALSDEDHSTHLAIPFVSQRGKLLGILYLISPKEHGMYNLESMRPFTAMFGWGATLIENEVLRNQIQAKTQ